MLHIATTTGNRLLHAKCEGVLASQLAALPLFPNLAKVVHLWVDRNEHRLSSPDVDPLKPETAEATGHSASMVLRMFLVVAVMSQLTAVGVEHHPRQHPVV